MATYRKKPVEVEAVRLMNTEESILKVVSFLGYGSIVEGEEVRLILEMVRANEGISIATLEGTMKADFGDYVIRGIQGEFYPCKPNIFEATYEKVSD
jgi:hypothetical protein